MYTIIWHGPPPKCDTCEEVMDSWDPFCTVHTHDKCIDESARRAVKKIFDQIRIDLKLPPRNLLS